MTTKIFVNLPVKDVSTSINFFTKLGFSFHPDYSSDDAGCLVIRDDIYGMLVSQALFATFTTRDVADATKVTEVALALQVGTQELADQVAEAALASGGQQAGDTIDDDFIYSRGFHDLDGHLWNVLHMKVPGEHASDSPA